MGCRVSLFFNRYYILAETQWYIPSSNQAVGECLLPHAAFSLRKPQRLSLLKSDVAKKKKKERMQNQHISMSKLLVNACRCRLCLRTQRDSGFINHLNHSKRIIIIYHRGRVCLCLKKKQKKMIRSKASNPLHIFFLLCLRHLSL